LIYRPHGFFRIPHVLWNSLSKENPSAFRALAIWAFVHFGEKKSETEKAIHATLSVLEPHISSYIVLCKDFQKHVPRLKTFGDAKITVGDLRKGKRINNIKSKPETKSIKSKLITSVINPSSVSIKSITKLLSIPPTSEHPVLTAVDKEYKPNEKFRDFMDTKGNTWRRCPSLTCMDDKYFEWNPTTNSNCPYCAASTLLALDSSSRDVKREDHVKREDLDMEIDDGKAVGVVCQAQKSTTVAAQNDHHHQSKNDHHHQSKNDQSKKDREFDPSWLEVLKSDPQLNELVRIETFCLFSVLISVVLHWVP